MVRGKTVTSSKEYADSIIDTVREPLIALDQDLRVVTVSRSFYEFFKVKPEETVGQLIYDLGNKQWDIPRLRELLETILPEKTSFDDYEVEHNFATIGHRIMLLNARQIERERGKKRIILLAIEDITERKRLEDLLTDREERYRRIFETASDGIILLEKNAGQIVKANAAAEKMFGFSEEEYIGKTIQDIGVPIDMSDFSSVMSALGKEGILNYEDVQIKTKFGQYIYTDVYMVDRAKLAQCNIRDVTERKKAEDILNKEKNKAQQYLDVAGVMIVALDSGGRIKLINKKGLEILGYEEHEILGQNWFDLCVPGGISAKVKGVFSKLMANDVAAEEYFENTIITKGGEERILAFHNTLLPNVSGETSGIICSGEDITGRKKSEEHLKEERVFIENALNTLKDFFFVFDLEGKFLRWNRTINAVTGYIDAEISMMKPADFFRKEDEKRVSESIGQAVAEGSTSVKAMLVTKDRRQIPYEFRTSLLMDHTGNLIGLSGVGIDLTVHNKLEAQLLHSQKMEAVGTLAGGISHDFNNILNVILGYGTMVMDTLADGSPAKGQMREVLIAADRAAALTNRLLVFSRKQVVEATLVNINALILGLEKMLVRLIREDIALYLELADQSLMILADTGQLEQVLINLAVNARDAMPEGGKLTISTRLEMMDDEYVAAYGYGKPGRYVLIAVADTGEGMDKETQEKIFEPFFTTKGIGVGTGLGLAISYGIIKQHNGFIKVYSEPEQGTLFKIYLPLNENAVIPGQKAESAVTVKGGHETILVAEDDVSVRKLMEIVLESFGYTVISAKDGEEAIAKFMEHRERISLVLLDIIMPKKNGKEVDEAIRKVSPRMKILFSSGYTMNIIKPKELTEGSFNFIQKPFLSKDLLAKVREILDR